MSVLAITGGTGFVGRRLIDRAVGAGHAVRGLTRRPQPPRDGVTWVEGALDRPASLAALVEGADAVVHVAGVVNARDRAGFVAGNVTGTAAVIEATEGAGVRRFVHVSSLSAREPNLSLYGGSKAEGEALVRASGLDWTIVRPPAIYGPGDTELLEMFRLAKRGVVPLPPPGRMAILHVDDLVALLLTLATTKATTRAMYDVDDATPGGFTHVGFAQALGRAVGQRVLPLPLPGWMMRAAARAARAVQGDRAKLTPDRVAYFCHPDWTADPARLPPPMLWRPRIAADDGLAATARWYRAQGLL